MGSKTDLDGDQMVRAVYYCKDCEKRFDMKRRRKKIAPYETCPSCLELAERAWRVPLVKL